MTNSTTYSLRKIVPHLYPGNDPEETRRITRKLQNLVTPGLLHPIPAPHGGRGVHHRYSQYELYKARTLLEMEQFQIPNTVLRLIANLFDDCNPDHKSALTRDSSSRTKIKQKLRKMMSDAITGKCDILLVINSNTSSGLQANLSTSAQFKPTWRSAIVLNLTEIIRTVR